MLCSLALSLLLCVGPLNATPDALFHAQFDELVAHNQTTAAVRLLGQEWLRREALLYESYWNRWTWTGPTIPLFARLNSTVSNGTVCYPTEPLAWLEADA